MWNHFLLDDAVSNQNPKWHEQIYTTTHGIQMGYKNCAICYPFPLSRHSDVDVQLYIDDIMLVGFVCRRSQGSQRAPRTRGTLRFQVRRGFRCSRSRHPSRNWLRLHSGSTCIAMWDEAKSKWREVTSEIIAYVAVFPPPAVAVVGLITDAATESSLGAAIILLP